MQPSTPQKLKNCNPERNIQPLLQNVTFNLDKNVTHYFSAIQHVAALLISKCKNLCCCLLLCAGTNITAVLRSKIYYYALVCDTSMQANHSILSNGRASNMSM